MGLAGSCGERSQTHLNRIVDRGEASWLSFGDALVERRAMADDKRNVPMNLKPLEE
jgi:hypothetical protein